MAQTAYTAASAVAFAGLKGDIQNSREIHKVNAETAAIPFGVAVARGSTENAAILPATAAAEILGVVLSTFAAENQGLSNSDGVAAAGQMTVIKEGDVWVKVEETVVAGDPVFVRFASGTGTQLGAFRKSVDSGTARKLPNAKYEIGASAAGFALVVLSAPGDVHEELSTISYEHAQVTGDTTVKLLKTPADRSFVITDVVYNNPTGLAQDTTNFFNIKVLNGSEIAANWSTETGAQGTIAADTFVSLVNGTLAKRTVPPATVISLMLDEDGTATLPAGRVAIRGYYL